jgi:thiol-disulfide isomerase/thioredoxin
LPAPARELSPGDAAPALVLPDLDGVMRDLARYRGQPVVLNVWASWCPPCIREMPSLQRLHERAAGRFAVVTVSVDDDRRAARALVAKAGLSVPVLLDAGGRRLAAWGTVKYPETWVLDAEGRVVDRVIGEKDWAAPPVVAFLEGL